MKMKRNMKRIVSGLLAAVTILSGALSPLAASAAETGQPMPGVPCLRYRRGTASHGAGGYFWNGKNLCG